ncbi:MAG: sodium:proton antiporter, partial [Deltaproteobacteria bacterium]|nr:sodium:proton antiporter [Deltaproteobacteria bacterium]
MARAIMTSAIIFVFLSILFPFLDDNSWATSQHLNTDSPSIIESPAYVHSPEGHGHHGSDIGQKLPLWTGIPFLGILLSIAIFPLVAPNFWHHHFPKISAFWALIFALPFVYVYHGPAIHEILHIYLIDYFPFIMLLWALFTISG